MRHAGYCFRHEHCLRSKWSSYCSAVPAVAPGCQRQLAVKLFHTMCVCVFLSVSQCQSQHTTLTLVLSLTFCHTVTLTLCLSHSFCLVSSPVSFAAVDVVVTKVGAKVAILIEPCRPSCSLLRNQCPSSFVSSAISKVDTTGAEDIA